MLGQAATIDATALAGADIGDLLAFIRDREPINLPLGTVDGAPVLDWSRLTQPFNMTRSPAGTVNAGFTAKGLPVGLQIVGPQHGDRAVLNAVAYLETTLAP